jgi:signal transduction histidine kinase
MHRRGNDIEALTRAVSELTRQLDAVRRIAANLSTAIELEELIPQALHTTLTLVEADAGSILLHHAGKGKLVFECVIGEKSDALTGMELEPDQGLAGQVFQSGGTRVSDDVGREPDHFHELGERVGYLTTNMVTVPLKSLEAAPLGVMQVLNKRGGCFDEYDVRLIEIMAAQIAAAIGAARLHAEARLATVVRFIGNISHDVKNMITPAIMGAEMLQLTADDCFRRLDARLAGSSPAQADAESVARAMETLRRSYPEIVELVLAGCSAVQQRMAEIGAAIKGVVSEPHFEPTDVTAIAQRVGKMLSPQAQKKGIAVSIEPLRELPLAVVDGKQLYNAIYNLMLNAIDACGCGDTVALRLDAPPDAGGAAACIVVECADTGPGMTEQVKAKLFTEQAISTKPMGTGLGTRIVKNVVDAHGGTLEVESAVGVGTTIRCRLPVGGAAAERRPEL